MTVYGGYTCGVCDTWVPFGATHQCQGKKLGSGATWTLSSTPDWTSLYLSQIVGFLAKIERHLNPEIAVDMTDIFGDRCMSAKEAAAEVEEHFTNTNKEKAMAMSDVVGGLLVHELQRARSVRDRAISYINELRVQISEHETVVGNANVTIDEIERALIQGGVEIPKEVE